MIHPPVFHRSFFVLCFLVCTVMLILYNTDKKSKQGKSIILPSSAHKLYPSNWSLINLKRFEFNLNSDVCQNNRVQLLVIVTSHPGHVDLRRAFRRALPTGLLRSHNISRAFLLARINTKQSGNYRQVDQSVIDDEHFQHQDIIQGSFLESYKNLSYKHIMGLKHATSFCPQANYVLKMDDDIAVDLFQLLHLVRSLNVSGLQIAGAVLQGDELLPLRDKGSKWYVSYDEYAKSRYPAFVSGWAYVTTIEAARKIVRRSESSPFFWVDDVYVTGILANLSGVERVDIRKRLTIYSNHIKCCVTNRGSACDYFIGPMDDAGLLEAFHLNALHCRLESCRPSDGEIRASRCVIANNRPAGDRIVFGQVIPISRK